MLASSLRFEFMCSRSLSRQRHSGTATACSDALHLIIQGMSPQNESCFGRIAVISRAACH